MISTEDISNLGWPLIAVSADGGSTLHSKEGTYYTITSHIDNVIYKRDNDPLLSVITLEELDPISLRSNEELKDTLNKMSL